jgi:hypothetical protein
MALSSASRTMCQVGLDLAAAQRLGANSRRFSVWQSQTTKSRHRDEGRQLSQSSLTACSINSASHNTRCTSWIMGRL